MLFRSHKVSASRDCIAGLSNKIVGAVKPPALRYPPWASRKTQLVVPSWHSRPVLGDIGRKKYYKSKSSYSGVCPMTFASHLPPAIQRTFSAIPESGMEDIESWLVRDHLGVLPSITWDEVSESMRVLIVSEAGTGKTYECKTRQELLWDRGEPAFYLELSELAMASLEDLLTSEAESRLKVWLTSQSDVATFFLDSIDELRLTLKSFKTALNKLSKALSGHLARARIVITTRPIPVDLQLISRYLPVELVREQDVTPSAEGFAQAVMGKAEIGRAHV